MSEHGGTVHSHQAHHGPLPKVRETPRGKGIKAVVVSTRNADCRISGGRGDIDIGDIIVGGDG